ncbi:MAG: nucleoside deaminase [Candidatus Eisenbacteria sp.]|nr:nucleoside deaminase [Candidatus Eisenbacteria bacterium]
MMSHNARYGKSGGWVHWMTMIAMLIVLAPGCARDAGDQAQEEILDDPRATELDRQMIARTYELARAASEQGNPPFAAVLVKADSILAEAVNTGISSGDVTRHAELSLVSDASRQFGRGELSKCTLYTSTEPCVMCSGAIRWAGIPRVVYGAPQNLGGRFQEIPCREVLGKISPETEVIGPVMSKEGEQLRSGFHRKRG